MARKNYKKSKNTAKAKTLTTKVAKLATEVYRNRPEVKYYVVAGTAANIYTTASQGINLIGSMTQSDGGSGRTGNQVFVKSIKMRLRWTQPSADTCDRASMGCRVIISRAKEQTYNTAIDESYLISESSQWMSPSPNPFYATKVDIIADRSLNMPYGYSIGDGKFPEAFMSITKSINKTVTWDQDSSALMKNGLYAEFFSNQSNKPLTVYFQYVIAYTDC